MFYTDDKARDRQCQDLQRHFTERFPGLLLIWDEADRNNIKEWQKFTLKEAVSGQKIRLVFVTNDAFENDEMRFFLLKFEDRMGEFVMKSNKPIRYKNSWLEIES